MNINIEHTFEAVQPEEEFDFVSTPQILVMHTKENELKVIVYLMINTAYVITEGFAVSGLGTMKLFYRVNSGGVVCASQKLAKIIYTFPNPQGMCTNFRFFEEDWRGKRLGRDG